MLNSKRALSPLIAAVLLIVVVVGIGAVVTGIVRDLVSSNQKTISGKDDEMACSRDVDVDVIMIDGALQFCEESGNIIVAVVENKGIGIDDFQMTVLGDAGIFKNDSVMPSETLAPGEAKELRSPYSGVGDVEIVKFVPMLKKTGSSGHHFCSEVALTTEVLPACP